MINKVMLTMESRIHGDMYVRFGGRLVETYHRKVEKRCWPSLLKEIAEILGINKRLTTHTARKTFASTILLNNDVPIEIVSKLLGHSSIRVTEAAYAQVMNKNTSRHMNQLTQKLYTEEN